MRVAKVVFFFDTGNELLSFLKKVPLDKTRYRIGIELV